MTISSGSGSAGSGLDSSGFSIILGSFQWILLGMCDMAINSYPISTVMAGGNYIYHDVFLVSNL